MENSNSKKSGITVVLLGVALAAVGFVGLYQFQNAQEAKRDLAMNVEQTNELAVKKGQLEDQVAILSTELQDKIRESEEFAAKMKEMDEADAKRKAYSYKANNERKKMLKLQEKRQQEIDSLQSQLTELNSIKSQMAEDLKVVPILKDENAKLKEEVKVWEAKYAALEKEFKSLSTRYKKVIYDAAADNFSIEVLAKNGKLTSKARKAKTVSISFLMPEFLQKELKGKETLYLSLFDEKIQPLAGFSEEVTINSKEGDIPVAVHGKQVIDASETPQVITFKVPLDEKLESGFYQGKVYSKNNYFGTVNFRLR